MCFLLQVAFTLFRLGLWTPSVAADSPSCGLFLKAEDVTDLSKSRV